MNAALLFQLYLFGRKIRKQTRGTHGDKVLSAALLWLCSNGHHTAKELAVLLGVSASTVSEQINQAVDKGLLTETVSHRDKRLSWLELTPAGQTYLGEITKRMNQTCVPLIDRLTDQEKAILTLLLNKLVS